MHQSYLEFSCHVEDLLFKGVTVYTVGGMIGLCISVALFTFSYEGVRMLRQHFATRLSKGNSTMHMHMRSKASTHLSESDLLIDINSENNWKRKKAHLIQTAFYMTQVAMSYMLMLIVMSYNAWLAITVFASAGLSYYFFSTFIMYRPTVIPIEILPPEGSQ